MTPKGTVLLGAGVFGATVGLLGLAFSLTATLIAIAVLGIGIPLVLWALSPVVRVTEAGAGPTGVELRCGSAHIDLAYLGEAKTLSESEFHARIGIEASERDFVCFSPWVHTAVAVQNTDETDPIANWVVCSRHPERLIDALRRRTPSR
nr:DUF3093 family protein [Flaviflexus huanghaiensis]